MRKDRPALRGVMGPVAFVVAIAVVSVAPVVADWLIEQRIARAQVEAGERAFSEGFEAGRQAAIEEIHPELSQANADRQAALEAYQRTRQYAPATLEERQAAFDELVSFEQEHAGDPVTENLLQAYTQGPLLDLVKTTFGHIPDLNYDVTVSFKPRDAFNNWLIGDDDCDYFPDDPDDVTVNGSTYFFLGASRPSEITVTDELRVYPEATSADFVRVPINTVGDLREILMHELAGHALPKTSYRYRPRAGEGTVFLHGLAIYDSTIDPACPQKVWGNLNEAAINLMVLEVSMEDEAVTEARMLRAFGGWDVRNMRALELFIVEAAGMSRMEFMEYHLLSETWVVEGELDRRINERIRSGALDGSSTDGPVAIERRALDLVQHGDIEQFCELMEEYGLTCEGKVGP